MYRTHTCGCLRACNVNQTVTLAGWVQKVRNLGAMTFIDLRDRYGITQIVVEEHSPAEARETVCRVGREWVIQVVGKVVERQSKNPKMPTGDIEVTAEKVAVLQKADKIFIDMLREADLYDKVWQAGVMLLPVQSVGVMGDERTYESCVALRAVTSTDGMTADWVHLPYDFLAKVSNEIINKVNGVNRVVYDISSKPPATIEWE